MQIAWLKCLLNLKLTNSSRHSVNKTVKFGYIPLFRKDKHPQYTYLTSCLAIPGRSKLHL